MSWRTAAAAAVGYALGSTPSADLATRLATAGSVDVRDHGSGNPGATNVAQVLGKQWGAGVMVADTLKGIAAAVLGRRIGGDDGGWAAGAAAVVGHVFPVWSRFRGGKGIATSGGASMALFPAYVPIDIAVASVAGRLTEGRLHVGMTLTSATWVAASVLWWRRRLPNAWGPRPAAGMVAFTAVSSSAVVWRFWNRRAGADG